MAEGFIKAYSGGDWTVPGIAHQTSTWSEFVAKQRKPVALIIVDAMRYEIGVELAARLERLGEVKLQPAIAALPSITPVGMAALLPGASGSFSVGEQRGKLVAEIEGTFLATREARVSYMQAKVPGLAVAKLGEVVSGRQPRKSSLSAGRRGVFVGDRRGR